MEFDGGAEGAGAGKARGGEEKSWSCAEPEEGTESWAMTLTAGFQRVLEPQRLQKRRTPSLVAQTSASMPESSTFSRDWQWLQTRERRPSSISAGVTGGKSMSQKLRWASKKATP